MLLPDHVIKAFVESGVIGITPFEPTHLQPASYDLTLDDTYIVPPYTSPGDMFLLSTEEVIELPNFVQGQLHGRSSLAREGVMIHISAGFVDPGFRGTLTLETVNFSRKPKILPQGTRVAQIAFLLCVGPSTKPYQGSYQDQRGPTASRREQLPEADTSWLS